MEIQSILDREELFERLDNDYELLQEFIEMFLEDYPSLVSEIESAVASKNSENLKIAAHTLKGSVGNFCAQGAFDAAFVLEQCGSKNDFSQIDVQLVQLRREMEQVETALKALAEEL